MAKNTSFKGKTVEEIEKLLKEKREELRSLRFTARPKDSSLAAKVRKDIARLLTEKTVQTTNA